MNNFSGPDKRSLLFAPMEGVTDAHYRELMMELYPEWDYFFTDFLRLPTVGHYKEKHFINHFGETIYRNEILRAKTAFQLMIAPQ